MTARSACRACAAYPRLARRLGNRQVSFALALAALLAAPGFAADLAQGATAGGSHATGPSGHGGSAAQVPTGPRPALLVAPVKIIGGPGGDRTLGLRLQAALALAGREEGWDPVAAPAPGGSEALACFSSGCAQGWQRRSGAERLLLARAGITDSVLLLELAYRPSEGARLLTLRRARQPGDSIGLLVFARTAAADLFAGRGAVEAGDWKDFPWVRPKDTIDQRAFALWSSVGLGAFALWAAVAQNQGSWDPVGASPLSEPLPSGVGLSSLRGAFAAPPQGARVAALGGAGTALPTDAGAVFSNPAGLSALTQRGFLLAQGNQADGTPKVLAAYAGPAFGHIAQGAGIAYAGDGLYSEVEAGWAGAYDLAGLGETWEGWHAGFTLKGLMAQAGAEGEGIDRSRGRSLGLSIDAGLLFPLTRSLTASLAFRDLLAGLWHRNDLLDRQEGEWLPPEVRLGAACRIPGSWLFLLEGQKGWRHDQTDQIRVGGENTLWELLDLRTGYRQIFGAETVRFLTGGFGLDSRAFVQGPGVSLHYAYEFGLGDHAALGRSHRFSLEGRF